MCAISVGNDNPRVPAGVQRPDLCPAPRPRPLTSDDSTIQDGEVRSPVGGGVVPSVYRVGDDRWA
jgi:hypothetical protein